MTELKSNCSISAKRRIHEIDDTIEQLTHEIKNLNDFVSKSEFECALMTVKLKREKVKALTAVAKSKVLLADMEVMIAEGDLLMDLERLKNCQKKKKLDGVEGDSQQNITQDIPKPTTNSVLVQTTKSMHDKKKKKKSRTAKNSFDDISSDETVYIPTIYENNGSLVETSQSSRPTELLNNTHKKSPANSSDSEVSLSSSIKAEFNNPYSKPETPEAEKKAHAKKSKLDKKVESKSKSNSSTQRTQSPSIKTKTVAEINRSVFIATSKNTSHTVSTPNTSRLHNAKTLTSTFVPVIITQAPNIGTPMPSTSTMSPPCLYINNPVTQANRYQAPRSGINCQSFTFYGSKQ